MDLNYTISSLLFLTIPILLLIIPSVKADNVQEDINNNMLPDMRDKLPDIIEKLFVTQPKIENRSLEQIYQAALKEPNGPMVVYAGGTARGQGASTKQAFEQRFPGLNIEIVTDYSIYQGPRIDVQLANNSLIPDVVQLQTIQDFPRWKKQGHLLQYKPANWSKVYRGFRDEDGYYTGNMVFLFSTMVNSQKIGQTEWPKNAEDFLSPKFANGQLVIVHPNMDDIVLFYFKKIVEKYGYEYLAKFARQKPTIVCEGFAQLNAIGLMGPTNGTEAVAPAAFGSFVLGNESIPQLVFNTQNGDEPSFATYAQYAAIFKKAKRPETAKLYVNWLLEKESPNIQQNIWSVRMDVEPAQGYKQIWEYPNSNHSAFLAFMEDYEERERFSRQIDLFFGHTNCDTSPLESTLDPIAQ